MKKIKTLTDIDYKKNGEGRLLFAALAILTTKNYRDKTPDAVIEILNKKADSFLDNDDTGSVEVEEVAHEG